MTRASFQARDVREPVPVPELTTPTSTVTANPDGSFDQSQSMVPTRIQRSDGSWADIDPNLHANPDGTYSPNVVTGTVVLSGGGIGPMVRMTNNDRSFNLGWLILPKPVIDGPTATYPEVITGVDLVLTVEDDGSVGELIVLKNREAAKNPWLAVLKFGVGLSSGTQLIKNEDESLSVTTGPQADPAFIAEAPVMWDSSVPPTEYSPPGGTATADDSTPADPDPTEPDEDPDNPAPASPADVKATAAKASPDGTGFPDETGPVAPSAFSHVARMATKISAGSQATAGKKIAPSLRASTPRAAADDDPGGSEATLEITPDQQMLDDPATVYPVYIDPKFSPTKPWTGGNAYNKGGSWAERTNKDFTGRYTYHPKKKHNHEPFKGQTLGNLQVGFMGWDPQPNGSDRTSPYAPPGKPGVSFTARSYVRFPIADALQQNAHIIKSSLNVKYYWAPNFNCAAQNHKVDLFASSSFDRKRAPGWNGSGSRIAYAYQSKCRAHGFGFNLTNYLKGYLKDHTKADDIYFMLRADNETGARAGYSWMQMLPKDLTISTNFNRAPNAPTYLYTSPGGPCTRTPAKTPVGNDDVTLSAIASDKDAYDRKSGRRDSLKTRFHVSDETGREVAAVDVQSPSNTRFSLLVRATTIQETWAKNDGLKHTYTWWAQTRDGDSAQGGLTGPASQKCAFLYDPRAPKAPGVRTPPPIDGVEGGPVGLLGQTVTFRIGKCQGAVAEPTQPCQFGPKDGPIAAYVYQVNGGRWNKPVPATGDAQDLRVQLTQVGVNTITVKAVSTVGVPGENASGDGRPGTPVTFSVGRPATKNVDGDFDGDGYPDVLLSGMPGNPGAWLATADKNSRLSAPVNIGGAGPGISSPPSPNDWKGAQLLHGDFTGSRVQDIVAYYPDGGTGGQDRAGQAFMLAGDNTGGPFSPYNGQQRLTADKLRDPTFSDTLVPSRLVAVADASGRTAEHTDELIGVLGDKDHGRELVAYGPDTAGAYFSDYTANGVIAPAGRTSLGVYEGDNTPDKGFGPCPACSWNNFSLAATRATGPDGKPTGQTALFALHKDGRLWESVAGSGKDGNGLPTRAGAPGTWRQISTPFNGTKSLISDVAVSGSRMCVDATSGFSTNGAAAVLWDCHANPPFQQWQIADSGAVTLGGTTDRCLDIAGGATAAGSKIQVNKCAGTGSQKWQLRDDRTLYNATSRRCVEIPGTPARGTPIQIGDCANKAAQRWTSGPGVPELISADVAASGRTELWLRNGRAITQLPLDAGGNSVTVGTYKAIGNPVHNWALRDGNGAAKAADTADTSADGTGGAELVDITWPDSTDVPVSPILNGETSYIGLPQPLGSGSELTVGLSFKADEGTTGIVLATNHGKPADRNKSGTPTMYIGTDGRLYAQFWNGVVAPLVSNDPVDDGLWHRATLVLSNGHDQTLYVDDNIPIYGYAPPAPSNTDPLTFAGGGVFNTLPWNNAPGADGSNGPTPDAAGTVHPSYFSGSITDVTIHNEDLSAVDLRARHQPSTASGPILLSLSSQKCLDDSGGGRDGSPVDLWDCKNNDNQKWNVNPNRTITLAKYAGDGAAGSGQCLSISGGPGATANGTKLVVDACDGGVHQQWLVLDNGSFYNPNSGGCVDDTASKLDNGTPIQLYDCNDTGAQRWASPARSNPLSATGTFARVADNTLCMEVPGGSTVNKAAVEQRKCSGFAKAQQWTVQPDNTVAINGKCLDNAAGKNVDGNPVQIYDCNSSDPQKWVYDRTKKALINKPTGKCLDAGGAGAGARFVIRTCSANDNQRFYIP